MFSNYNFTATKKKSIKDISGLILDKTRNVFELFLIKRWCMRGVDTYGLFILSGWPWHPYLIYFALCTCPSMSPLSHLHRLRLNAMPVRCHCSVCKGTFIAPHIKRNHDRTALKKQMVLQQNVWRPGLASVDPITGGTSTTVPIHLHNTPGPASLHPIDSFLCMPTPSVDLEDGASCLVLDVIIPPTNHDNC